MVLLWYRNEKQSFVSFGIILGLSIIIGLFFGIVWYLWFFYKSQTMENISVTGSAKKQVVSDRWNGIQQLLRLQKENEQLERAMQN